ncbi:tyrosine-type recombinase/integrase [Evansella halocellulosilytica]|uniref:tyrosine-type recombinase/integrase n=1 Tax=Evansella halocellulosilytica TaxID=2011013 RepID=UPI000BB68559|nr:tyrosine-type recombinase/integrase [Evansella halocellulosilytica]
MARIYKKKTKKGIRWGYRVYLGKDPVTNKELKKAKEGFLTQKDAKLAAALVERQAHRGEFLQPSNITVEKVYLDWEKHYASQGAKESSVRARRIAFKHVLNKFSNTPIQKINKKAYQDVIDELAEKFSSNYISSIHSSAHMFFDYALHNKLVNEVPTKDIRLPKKRKTVDELEENQHTIQQKFLEKEELEEFLKKTKEIGLEGDLLTFTLLSYTGMRVGEMVALKWPDIDFVKHTVRIVKTYYNPTNNKTKYKLLTPKTDGSIRTITIDPLVIELLKKHKAEQDQNRVGGGD